MAVKTTFVTMMLASAAAVGCQSGVAQQEPADPLPALEASHATAADPFEPVPLNIAYDLAAAAIGEKLFNDPILSDDGKVKCVDCHDLGRFGGGDGKAVPEIDGRERGLTNATTVFNIALFFRYGWNGAHDDMEHHLDAPMRSARVMGIASWEGVVARVKANASYRRAFEAAFPDRGVTEETVRHAIAEYQRSLVTPNAPFDRMLRGEGHAGLSRQAAEGYALFKNLGCVTCHQGIGVGGNMFQRFGVMIPYPEGRDPTPADQGRYRVTQDEADMLVFRVPSLRNVAVTAPYFHDGSVATLPQAVRSMARHQLGRDLDEEQVEKLVHFLYALTGEWQGKTLTAANAPERPPGAGEAL